MNEKRSTKFNSLPFESTKCTDYFISVLQQRPTIATLQIFISVFDVAPISRDSNERMIETKVAVLLVGWRVGREKSEKKRAAVI